MLTTEEAYAAMFRFLEEYYWATKSDDVGALLGSMSLLEDGSTADPAIRSEWLEVCRKIAEGKVSIALDLKTE